ITSQVELICIVRTPSWVNVRNYKKRMLCLSVRTVCVCVSVCVCVCVCVCMCGASLLCEVIYTWECPNSCCSVSVTGSRMISTTCADTQMEREREREKGERRTQRERERERERER